MPGCALDIPMYAAITVLRRRGAGATGTSAEPRGMTIAPRECGRRRLLQEPCMTALRNL